MKGGDERCENVLTVVNCSCVLVYFGVVVFLWKDASVSSLAAVSKLSLNRYK